MSEPTPSWSLNLRSWPWWAWLLVLVFLLLLGIEIVGLCYHRAGMQGLRAEVDRLSAAGQIPTVAQFKQALPPVDRERQNRAWRMLSTCPEYFPDDLVGLEARCLSSRSPYDGTWFDDETEKIGNSMPFTYARWRELREEGSLVLTLAGWATEDLHQGDAAEIKAFFNSRRRTLGHVVPLAIALGVAARISADPVPWLADLDVLVTSLQPSISDRDFFQLLDVIRLRDSAWLDAVVRGVNPGAWESTTVDLAQAGQQAFAGEVFWQVRKLHVSTTPDRLVLPSADRFYRELGIVVTNLYEQTPDEVHRWQVPFDVSVVLHLSAHDETYFRTGQVPPPLKIPEWCAPIAKVLGSMTGIWRRSNAESGIPFYVAENEHRQRRHRLAARLLAMYRRTGLLPEPDQLDGECQALCRGTSATVPIRYDLLGPGQFLLRALPTDLPSPLATGRSIRPAKIADVAFRAESWRLEMDIPKIPIQPLGTIFQRDPAADEKPARRRRGSTSP